MIPYSKKSYDEKIEIAEKAMLKIILINETLPQYAGDSGWNIFLDDLVCGAEELRKRKYKHGDA